MILKRKNLLEFLNKIAEHNVHTSYEESLDENTRTELYFYIDVLEKDTCDAISVSDAVDLYMHDDIVNEIPFCPECGSDNTVEQKLKGNYSCLDCNWLWAK